MLDENNDSELKYHMDFRRPDSLFNVIQGMDKLTDLLDMTAEQKEAESQQGVAKGTWLPEEDKILMAYVEQYGAKNWNSLQAKGLLKRNGKSCRLRWVNQLKPGLQRNMHGKGCKRFSESEEKLVIELQKTLGNRWAQISKHLPGRTDNDVKNFWNLYVKRQERAKRQRMGMVPLKQCIENKNSPASSMSNMDGNASENMDKAYSPSHSEDNTKGKEVEESESKYEKGKAEKVEETSQSNDQSYNQNSSQSNGMNNQKSTSTLSSLQQRRSRGGNGLNLRITAAVTNLTINCPKLTTEEEEKIAQSNVLDWLKTPTTPSSNYFPWLSQPSPSMRKASPRCNPQKGFAMPHKVHSPFGGLMNTRLLSPGAFFLSPKASPRIPRHVSRSMPSIHHADNARHGKEKLNPSPASLNNPSAAANEILHGSPLNVMEERNRGSSNAVEVKEQKSALNHCSFLKEEDMKDKGSPINPSGLSTSMNELAIAEKLNEFDRFVDENNSATSKLADISPSDFDSSEWFPSSETNVLFDNSESQVKGDMVNLDELIANVGVMDKELIELIANNYSSKSSAVMKSSAVDMALPLDLSTEMMNQSLISPNTPYLPFLPNTLVPLPEDSILFGSGSSHSPLLNSTHLSVNESSSNVFSDSIPILNENLLQTRMKEDFSPSSLSPGLSSPAMDSNLNAPSLPASASLTKGSLLAPLPGKSTSFLPKNGTLYQNNDNNNAKRNGFNAFPSIQSKQSNQQHDPSSFLKNKNLNPLPSIPTTKSSPPVSAVNHNAAWNAFNSSSFLSAPSNGMRDVKNSASMGSMGLPPLPTVQSTIPSLARSNSSSSKGEVIDENCLSGVDLALKKSLARESLLLLYKGGLISNQSLVSTFQKIIQSDDSNFLVTPNTTAANASSPVTSKATSPMEVAAASPSPPLHSTPDLSFQVNSNTNINPNSNSNSNMNPSNDINVLTENILKANPSWSIDDLLNVVIGDSAAGGSKAISQNTSFASTSLNAVTLEQQQQQKIQMQRRQKVLHLQPQLLQQQQQQQLKQNLFLRAQQNDARLSNLSAIDSISRLSNGSRPLQNASLSSINNAQKFLNLQQVQPVLGEKRASIGNSEFFFGA